MKNTIIYTLFFLMLFSCKPNGTNKYEFQNLSFNLKERWDEYKRDDWLITFVDAKDTSHYKFNFTIMILDKEMDSNNPSLDTIIKNNLDQLKDVYVKMNIISYDTNSINDYKCRKVSFASLTKNKEIMGTVIYLMKSENSMIMASFQGDNKSGVFEKRVKEISEIVESFKF